MIFPWWILPTIPAAFLLFDQVYRRVRVAQMDEIRLKRARAEALRHIAPQENGQLGVVVDGVRTPIIRNLDDHSVVTPTTTISTDDVAFRFNRLERLMLAMAQGHTPPQQLVEQLVAENPRPTLQSATIGDLMQRYSFTPTLDRILIGETVDETTNQIAPLTLSIPASVHIVCTGASGLGKSTLLEAVAFQLAMVDNVQLAAVDYGSGTFDALASRLQWPLADTPELAIALMHELIKVAEDRRRLYKDAPRARTLMQYNALAGVNLPFVLAFFDEAPDLLENPYTREPVIQLSRMGRKYGIGLVFGGTEFKVDTMPSEARGNCQARIAFWLEAGLSRSVLNTAAASELEGKGDVWVKKPGQVGLIRGHTPLVVDADYTLLNKPAVTQSALVPAVDPHPNEQPTDDEILSTLLELAREPKFSYRKAEMALFDYAGGHARDEVKRVALANAEELKEVLQ